MTTTTTAKRGSSILDRKVDAAGSSDKFQTPIYPLNVLMKAVGNRMNDAIILDPASGHGNICRYFNEQGFFTVGGDIDTSQAIAGNFEGHPNTSNVTVQNNQVDFLALKSREEFAEAYGFDGEDLEHVVVVTNPPYTLKNDFIEQCLSLRLPYALLMPATALGSKQRWDIFKEHGVSLVIPRDRVNYTTPSGKGSGAWFDSMWFCHNIPLPAQLNFEDVE